MNLAGNTIRLHRQQLGLSQAKLAELSGVSQHLLSAFELQKVDLPANLLDAVSRALSDKRKVESLARRAKRYREHRYVEIQKLEGRVARAIRTEGNKEYLDILGELSKLHSARKGSKLSALSLFSGCGGFSLGFSAAGFSIKGFLEIDSSLRQIYRQNFPETVEMGGDITRVTQSDPRRFYKQIGPVDILIGGPPCQGFSLSGKRRVDDPRNQLFKHYLKFVDVFRPRIAVLENVKLLTSMMNQMGGWVKNDISDEFRRHGYHVEFFEINAKDYGVPQHRERVLFIAARGVVNKAQLLPERTHVKSLDLFSSFPVYRSFADACSDLEFIESGGKSKDVLHWAVEHPAHVIDWLWDVPEGRSAHENADPSKRPPSGYNTTYKRQVWTEPASTVQTTFGMISGCRNVHPIATRSLTIREAARIQSFPDSYNFAGSLGEIRTGIGNAVPPLLAYTLALHLKKLL